MPAVPKPRPAYLEKQDRKAKTATLDKRETAKVIVRSGNKCEIFVIGEGHCGKRGTETHHMIGGWKLRARGKSALAIHKQRACDTHHGQITGNAIRRVGGTTPMWNDVYERVE